MEPKYALPTRPIPFPSGIAAKIGLAPAVILQQIYFYLQNPEITGIELKEAKGQKWICISSQALEEAKSEKTDCWLSAEEISKAIAKLEGLGLIESQKMRSHKYGQAEYYTIVNEKFDELVKGLWTNS